ncbi:hypothetical protein BC828DRAFT_377889 [Blastocladiella britannica]|nr:hypothetical protein BC828DRAFT_377889 [Blastocladiella britannica]
MTSITHTKKNVSQCVEDIQWFSFSITSNIHADLSLIASIIPEPLRLFSDYASFAAANTIALCIVFLTFTLISVIVLLMHRQAKIPIWSLRLLRVLCSLLLTALSIPVLTLFIGGAACIGPGASLNEYGVACSSPSVLPLVVFNVVGLLLFIPLLLLGALVFIETSPTSESPLAKAHGRVDLRGVVARIVFVISSVFTMHQGGGWQWFHMILVTGGLANVAYWTVISQACVGDLPLIFYLKLLNKRVNRYYNNAMTAFRAGMALGACFSMIASMAVHGVVGANTNGWWMAILPAGALGVMVGASVSVAHAKYFLKRTVRDWHRILKLEATIDMSAGLSSGFLQPPPGKPEISESPTAAVRAITQFTDSSSVTTRQLPKRTQSMEYGKSAPQGSQQTPPALIITGALMSPLSPTPTLTVASPTQAPIRSPMMTRKSSPLRTVSTGDAGGQSMSLSRGRGAPAAGRFAMVSTGELPMPPSSGSGGTTSGPASGSSPPNERFGPPISPARRKVMMSSSAHGSMPSLEDSEKVLNGLIQHGSADALHEVMLRQPKRKIYVFDSPLQVEVCVRFIRENPSTKQITIGLQLLERGLLEFPRDPMLTLLAATYLSAYYGFEGERTADMLIKELQSARNGIPLDVKFLAYCRERANKNQGSHVLDRTELETLEREVRFHHLRALTAIRDVWEAIRVASTPNVLAEIVSRLSSHRVHASANYSKLLERNPRDKNLLRSYAQFLIQVEADNAKASQVLELADDVEEYDNPRQSADNVALERAENASSFGVPPPVIETQYLSTVNGRQETISMESMELASGSDIGPDGNFGGNGNVSFQRPQRRKRSSIIGGAEGSSSGFPGGVGGGASQLLENNSQTSGASSRAARQKIQLKRMLFGRVVKPLSDLRLLQVSFFILLATITAVFIVCLRFFTASTTALREEFTLAREARRNAVLLVESMRLMVYANSLHLPVLFASVVDKFRATFSELVTQYLPSVAAYDSSVHHLLTKIPLFTPHPVGVKFDYLANQYSPVEVVNAVMQSARVSLSMASYGTLTAQAWAANTDLLFITTNLSAILDALRLLPDFGVNAYTALSQTSTMQLVVTLSAAVVMVLVNLYMSCQHTLGNYFSSEIRIQTMLLTLPKRAAAELVTEMEEEIENFREIVDGGQETTDEAELRLLSVPNIGGDDKKKMNRRRKYYLCMIIPATIAIGVLAAMFGITYAATSVQQNMSRLYRSSDRAHLSISSRMIAREFFFADGVLDYATILQYTEAKATELGEIQDGLEEEQSGLNAEVPQFSIFSRNCSVPSACPNVKPNPAVGFTLSLSELPLNTEFWKMVDALQQVNLAILHEPGDNILPSSPDHIKFQLYDALVDDISNRLVDVDVTLSGQMSDSIAQSSAYCIIAFVVLVAVVGASLAVFLAVILQRLRNEARALTAILHLIPPPHLKDAGELQRYIESGGLVTLASQDI